MDIENYFASFVANNIGLSETNPCINAILLNSNDVHEHEKKALCENIVKYFINKVQKIGVRKGILKNGLVLRKYPTLHDDIINDVIVLVESGEFDDMMVMLEGTDIMLGERIGLLQFNFEDNVHWSMNPSLIIALIYVVYLVKSDRIDILTYIYDKYFAYWSIKYLFLRILTIYGSIQTFINVMMTIENPRLFKLRRIDAVFIRDGKMLALLNRLYDIHGVGIIDKNNMKELAENVLTQSTLSTYSDDFMWECFKQGSVYSPPPKEMLQWMSKNDLLNKNIGMYDVETLKILLKSNVDREYLSEMIKYEDLNIQLWNILPSLWKDGYINTINNDVMAIIIDQIKEKSIFEKEQVKIRYKNAIYNMRTMNYDSAIIVRPECVTLWNSDYEEKGKYVVETRDILYNYTYVLLYFLFNGNMVAASVVDELYLKSHIDSYYTILDILSDPDNVEILYHLTPSMWNYLYTYFTRYIEPSQDHPKEIVMKYLLGYRTLLPKYKTGVSICVEEEMARIMDNSVHLFRFIKDEGLNISFDKYLAKDWGAYNKASYLVHLLANTIGYTNDEIEGFETLGPFLLTQVLKKSYVLNPFLSVFNREFDSRADYNTLFKQSITDTNYTSLLWTDLLERVSSKYDQEQQFSIIKKMYECGARGNGGRPWYAVVNTNDEYIIEWFINNIIYGEGLFWYISITAIQGGRLNVLKYMKKNNMDIYITDESVNNALRKEYIRTLDFLYDNVYESFYYTLKESNIHDSLLQYNHEDGMEIPIGKYLNRWMEKK